MERCVIMVTGASAGIGAEFARQAAARGAKLALVARGAEALAAVVRQCGGAPNAFAIVADVTMRAEIERAIATTLEHYGHLDVLINNVGRGISRPPSQLTDDDLDEMMAINVKSALYGMQAVLPHFKARDHGQIINVSSTLGRQPSVLPRSGYSASKHFLNSLTANFRDELAPTHPGIAVTLVSPGLVYTDFGNHALHGGIDSRDVPGGQEASEVAAVLVHAVETRAPDLYTRAGQKAKITSYLGALTADPPSSAPKPPATATAAAVATNGAVGVRRAHDGDALRMAPLFQDYLAFYGQTHDAAAATEYLRERVARGEGIAFVAECEGATAGLAMCYPTWGSLDLAPHWVLHDLYVHAAYRKRGVGLALCEAALEAARASGARRVVLETAHDNHAARAMYAKLGFKEDHVFGSFAVDLRASR